MKYKIKINTKTGIAEVFINGKAVHWITWGPKSKVTLKEIFREIRKIGGCDGSMFF
jgi:hypothetical protein